MKLYKPLFTALFTLIFALGAGTVHAQDVVYSQYEKFDFRSGEFSVVGEVQGILYVFRGSNEGYYLDAYNNAMELQATVILDFFPKRTFASKFYAFNDRIIALYQVTESNSVTQFAALLDAKGRLQKGPVEIATVKSSFLGGRSGLFSSAISNNKEKLVIYGAGSKGNNVDVEAIWLDTALNKQSKSKAHFETDNDAEFGEGVLADDGTFFFPVYTPLGSRQYADGIWLLSLSQGSNVFDASEVPLNGLFAAGTYMKLDQHGQRIYVGGFYSDKKNGHLEGVLYTYYDINEHQFEKYKTIPFSEKLRNATGERNTKRAFNDYQVRQIIVRNDGGFVLIAENFYITTRSGYSPGFGYYSWYYPTMSSSIREYNYEDIMALSYDGQGRQEWASFIRKNQYSQEDGGLFSSFALINTGGSLGFLFNDFNTNRSRMQLGSIDADGKVNVRTLTTYRPDEPDWLPHSGKQVSSNEIVVPCLRRSQICFAKVVF